MANGTASGNKPTGVVDLDSSQTLENKTLDSTSTVLGSSVENPSRLDVRKATQSELETYALTASDGQLCFATDSKKMYQVVDNALVDVGSASGGINYIPNSDFEIDADDWVGDTNLTIARSEVDPLRGTASGVISKGAVDATGQVVKTTPFTIDAADLAKKLYISADVDASDANYADGDLRWKIVKDPNGTPVTIRPNAEDILGGNFSRLAWFQSDASITEYELQIECNSVNASAYSVKIDNVSVGPREASFGSAMTDWIDYGEVPIQGTTTNPTKGTIVVDKFHGKRVGSSFIGRIDFIQSTGGTAGSGTYVIQLPDGINIDLDKVPSSNVYASGNVGFINSNENGGVERHGFFTVDANDSSRLFVQWVNTSGSALQYSFTPWSSTFLALSNNIFGISGQFEIPIQGWSSNALMSEDIGNREVRVRGEGNGAGSVTANVTPVDFNTTEDTTGSWDGSTFTAPETGDYLIVGKTSVTAVSTYYPRLWLDTGSGYVEKRAFGDTSISGVSKNFQTVITLNKGDKFQIRLTSTLTLSNSNSFHNIHIQKLAQPQTLLETETVAAHYTSSIGQPVVTGGTDLIFEDIEHDTHNAYNTSTGVYTVPITGYYNISAQATTEPAAYPATTALTVIIQVNGIDIAQHNCYGNGSPIVLTSNPNITGIDLVKGDTIKIRSFNVNANLITTGTAAAKNFFTIARIK